MKKKFNVSGMTCASCQSHVEKAVRKLDGVSDVYVNLLQNNMDVTFDDKICSISKIEEAVDKAGYKATLPEEKGVSNKNKDYSLFKLIFCIVDLLVLMYFSMGNMMWGWPSPKVFDMHQNPMGFALVQFILVLPICYIYRNYFISGFKKLFKLSPNMDSLIAVGATFSLAYGIYCLFMISLGHTEYHMYLYFESAGMILVFVSIGKYLEELSKKRTTDSLTKLMDLKPKTAIILDGDNEVLVNANDVKIGDVVVVKKGDLIPVDGKIIKGEASIDEANITGESIPVFKGVGDEVYSSCILTSGYLYVETTKSSEDTTIATIIKLVEEASNSKAPISRLADKVSGVFVPIIFSISLLVFIFNIIYIMIAKPAYVNNAFETALNFAITVIVIACPCALGLATPVAIMVGTGKGAQNGLLIKNAAILEAAHNITTVVLDKTGTITKGHPEVVDFIKYKDFDMESILYSFEIKSEHPLALAIVEYTKDKKRIDYNILNYEAIDGKGLRGIIDNDLYEIGNLKLLPNNDLASDIVNKMSNEGKTTLIVLKNKELYGIVAVKDEIKENSKEAIHLLQNKGIKVVMLTGDNEITANAIAKEVGVNKVIANVMPTDKANVINELKNKNEFVAMVGDGVNDAIALSSANLGIAIGAGSDVAIESADIVLLRNDLLDVLNVISLSKRTINTIKLGLFWAFFYNIICVILATGIFYYTSNGSFKMEPMYGSIAMSISSVSVVLNALTINLFKVKRNKEEIIKKEERKMNQLVLNVDGMMCMHCVKHVEDASKKVVGVINAHASLDSKTVTIDYEGNIDKEQIIKNITDAGYSVK